MDKKLFRINKDGKLNPPSQAKVEGPITRTSPHFNRSVIRVGNPVKSPNDLGQWKTDWEEIEYEGNADSKNARGTPLHKEK